MCTPQERGFNHVAWLTWYRPLSNRGPATCLRQLSSITPAHVCAWSSPGLSTRPGGPRALPTTAGSLIAAEAHSVGEGHLPWQRWCMQQEPMLCKKLLQPHTGQEVLEQDLSSDWSPPPLSNVEIPRLVLLVVRKALQMALVAFTYSPDFHICSDSACEWGHSTQP